MEELSGGLFQYIFELDKITEIDFEQEWRMFKAKSDIKSVVKEYYRKRELWLNKFGKEMCVKVWVK